MESCTFDSYSACLLAQSPILWFPSRLYKYCSPGSRSFTEGIEPKGTEVHGRKLDMMYFLWDLVKRFRARSKDSAVYFHGAGSRCSWQHGSIQVLPGTKCCGCQQTCLMRKPTASMFTSQTSTGFEDKSVYYLASISVSGKTVEGIFVTGYLMHSREADNNSHTPRLTVCKCRME